MTTRRTAPLAKWSCAALKAGTPGHHFSCARKRHQACLKHSANRTQSKGANDSRTNARRGEHPFQATEPIHDKPSRRRRVRQPATGHRRPNCPQDGQVSAADNAKRSRRHSHWNHEPLHRSRERKPQIRDGEREDHGRHGLASLPDIRHQLQKREKPPARTAVINRRVAQAEMEQWKQLAQEYIQENRDDARRPSESHNIMINTQFSRGLPNTHAGMQRNRPRQRILSAAEEWRHQRRTHKKAPP